MIRPLKYVVFLLLLAILAVPLSALASCLADGDAQNRCKSDCPMMTAHRGAIDQASISGGNPCCQISSALPVSGQILVITNSQAMDVSEIHVSSIAGILVPETTSNGATAPPPSAPSLQPLLCVFLI